MNDYIMYYLVTNVVNATKEKHHTFVFVSCLTELVITSTKAFLVMVMMCIIFLVLISIDMPLMCNH